MTVSTFSFRVNRADTDRFGMSFIKLYLYARLILLTLFKGKRMFERAFLKVFTQSLSVIIVIDVFFIYFQLMKIIKFS